MGYPTLITTSQFQQTVAAILGIIAKIRLAMRSVAAFNTTTAMEILKAHRVRRA